MKFPWFGRKKQKPLMVGDGKRPLSPDVDHTIDRRLYYRPIQPGAACPRCHKTLIQEEAAYIMITFDDTGAETDRYMVSGDFGHYCPNCPIVVINPVEVEPYLNVVHTKFGSAIAFAVVGRVALEGFTEEEHHIPLGEMESMPIVPFHAGPSSTKSKSKQRHRRKKK